MKRNSPLKRKTGLKARTPLKRSSFKSKPRKTTKAKKTKKPSMRLLKSKLWNECKRIVRLRYGNGDNTFNCYTCSNFLDKPAKAQTGHFIPSSVCSVEMRYDLDNLRVQCYRCNINLSGNWIEYEKRLNKEMGKGFTTKLKARNEKTKNKQYDSLYYIAKIEEYKAVDK